MANYTEKDFLEKGYTVKVMANGRMDNGDPVRYYESKEVAKAEADRLRNCGYKASLLQKGKKFTVWYKKTAEEKKAEEVENVSESVNENSEKVWTLSADVAELFGAKVVTCNLADWKINEKVEFNVDGKIVTRKIYNDKDVGLVTFIKGIEFAYTDFE